MRTTKHRLAKTAGFRDFTQGLRQMRPEALQAAAALIPVAAMAAAGATSVGKKIMDARENAQTYKEMLRLHPRLQKQSPEEVKRLYGTLRRFGPTIAKDPMVAGAWIQHAQEKEDLFDPSQRGQGVMGAVMGLIDPASKHVRMQSDLGSRAGHSAMLMSRAKDLQHATMGFIPPGHAKELQERVDQAEAESYAARGLAEELRKERLVGKARDAGMIHPPPRSPPSSFNRRKTAAEVLRALK